jgi:16S rRNA (guanine527-N7)-methyltransferase
MTITELGAVSEANGLLLSEAQLEKLGAYAGLLRAKNQVVNLISRKDEENIIAKHILHSLTMIFSHLALAGIPKGADVFDLGTGGGLPGIPIKIARPDISITLCDSIAKKITAVREMAQTLDLDNVAVFSDRAENLPKSNAFKKKYTVVLTRAVAPLDQLLVWSYPLLKKNGTLLALKGGNLEEEKNKVKKLKFVQNMEEEILSLKGYDKFAKEEKKIVRVTIV